MLYQKYRLSNDIQQFYYYLEVILEVKYAYIHVPWFTITFLSFSMDSTLVKSSSILSLTSSVSVVSEIIINHREL